MQARYSRFSQFIFLLGDVILLNASFLLAGTLRFQEIKIQNTEYYDYYVQLAVFLNLLWLLLSITFKTYNTGLSLEPRKSVGKTLNVFFWHLFLLLLFLVSLKKDEYSRLFLTYFYLFSAIGIMPWHFFYLRLLRVLRKRGGGHRKVVLVGEGPRLQAFLQALKNRPELGISVAAIFSDSQSLNQYEVSAQEELQAFLKRQSIDEMYVAFPPGDKRLRDLFYLAERETIRFRALPDLGLKHSKNLQIDFYDDVPVLALRSEPLELIHNRLLKRLGDVVVSICAIVLLYPWMFPLLALAVKLSGPGPVMFRQLRTGYRNKPFALYKFRSMVPNKNSDDERGLHDDARVTRLGHILRKHHLDELPQFWNVLKGEMSLIGPRPHMLFHTEEYRQLIEQYMVRHFVKPGITGLAQVNGLKGSLDLQKMEERVKTDVYYIENWSFLLDVSIAFRTLGIVLFGMEKN